MKALKLILVVALSFLPRLALALEVGVQLRMSDGTPPSMVCVLMNTGHSPIGYADSDKFLEVSKLAPSGDSYEPGELSPIAVDARVATAMTSLHRWGKTFADQVPSGQKPPPKPLCRGSVQLFPTRTPNDQIACRIVSPDAPPERIAVFRVKPPGSAFVERVRADGTLVRITISDLQQGQAVTLEPAGGFYAGSDVTMHSNYAVLDLGPACVTHTVRIPGAVDRGRGASPSRQAPASWRKIGIRWRAFRSREDP
jgi:hypothetical protein